MICLILKEMEKAIKTSRTKMSDYAPQIVTIKVPTDKIREVIGSGGAVIREICEVADVKIEIEDDGTTKIAGVGNEAIDKAKAIRYR